jgi:hypothetical protein
MRRRSRTHPPPPKKKNRTERQRARARQGEDAAGGGAAAAASAAAAVGAEVAECTRVRLEFVLRHGSCTVTTNAAGGSPRAQLPPSPLLSPFTHL